MSNVPSSAGLGVSFVIPVYNKRPFLPQVIAGLAAQRGDFVREFLFVDDGSTDGSRAEVEKLTAGWDDVRILSQRNQGPSAATNRGMAEARYPYIKLIDADDVLMPFATAMLLDALRKHPGAVWAHGRTEFYDIPDDALARLASGSTRHDVTETIDVAPLRGLFGPFCVGPSDSLISSAAVRQVGGCDPRVFVQDYSLALRLATVGTFVGIDAVVALCARTAPGRVNDTGPQVLHDLNLALAYFLAEHELPPNLARRAVRRATGRAYHWARRHEGAPLLSRWTALRLLAELPYPSPDLVRQSCAAFALSRPIRRPDPPVP